MIMNVVTQDQIKNVDAVKLGGELPSYYAKQSDVSELEKYENTTITNSNSNVFNITQAHAKKVKGGIEIHAMIITKTSLSANTYYDVLSLSDLVGKNPVSAENSLPCIGTTGTTLVGGLIVPQSSETASLKFYALGAIPSASTLRVQGLLRTTF